jgi:hypothetical protein
VTNPISFQLGAGASDPYGVPMMNGFYREFQDYIERRHPHCFKLLRSIEENAGHLKPDLETLLSDLQFILGIQNGLSRLGQDNSAIATDLETARELRGYLDAFIVDRCERFQHERSAPELQALFELRQFGPLWIFSTNYDRLIEVACEKYNIHSELHLQSRRSRSGGVPVRRLRVFAPAQDLASRDLMVGGQPQPGAEGLRLGLLPQVQADFREHRVHGAGMQAGDGDQVHAHQLIEEAARIVGGGILVVGVCLSA